MQKWEYLTVEFETDGYRLNDGDLIRYERSTERQRSTRPQLIETLNKLGREGWELTSKSPDFYFKRPISD